MLSRALRTRAGRATDDGFTLIEAIVSFTLFVTVMGGALYAIVNAVNVSHSSQQRVDAANVAQAFVTQARTNPQKVIADPGTSVLTSVGNGAAGHASRESFTVVRSVTFSGTGQTSCQPGSYFTVNVLVYRGASTSGAYLARSDSVVACLPS